MPASLRSDGVRGHPGMPFGIIPDSAFGFAGIPINLRKGGTVHKEASCTSQFAADKFEETMLLHSLELQWMAGWQKHLASCNLLHLRVLVLVGPIVQ